MSFIFSETTKSSLARYYRRVNLVWIAIFTLTVGGVTSFFLAETLIKHEMRLNGQLIGTYLEQHLSTRLFAESQNPSQPDLFQTFQNLHNLMHIEHVKFFSPSGKIIWSDSLDRIGQQAELDETVSSAMKGKIQMHYKLLVAPFRGHNSLDNNRDLLLVYKLHIPIHASDGRIVGVVEIYQKPEIIFDVLTSGLLALWLILFFAGGFYFFLSNYLLVSASNKLVKLTYDLDKSYRLASLGKCVSMILHETRNLLAGINLACRRLSGKNITYEERVQVVEDVDKPLEMSFKMMNDMLDFVSGNNVPLICEHHNVRSIVEDSHMILGSLLTTDRHKLIIKVPDDLTIYCNAQKLIHILINLMRNSSQSMTKSGEIIISAVALPEGVKLVVQDSGAGIPEDMLIEIFEPFVTHPNKNRSGLGLAIIRDLVQRHGGNISASNRATGGAEFTLFFPNGSVPQLTPDSETVLMEPI